MNPRARSGAVPDETNSTSLRALAERSDLAQYAEHDFVVLALETRFSIGDVHAVAAEALVDTAASGGPTDDRKADVVFVDEVSRTGVICQAWKGVGQRQNPPKGKVDDLNTAVNAVLVSDELPQGSPIALASDQFRSALTDGLIDTVEVWFCHNRTPNAEVQKSLEDVSKTCVALLTTHFGNKTVSVRALEVCPKVVDDWLVDPQNQLVVRERMEVPLDGFLTERGEGWKAAYGSVPGWWLADLYRTYTSDRLFAGNIRSDLRPRNSQQDINKGLQDTALHQPSRFWAYNNGVTALVGSFRKKRNASSLQVDGITIVNGAQTTGSLGRLETSIDPNCRVPIRFIASEDQSVINSIRKFNNTQNEILASDFRSQDRVQTRLVSEFEALGTAEYRGPRRGGAEAPGRTPVGVLSHELVAQALAAFNLHPRDAYHRKNEIWLNDSLYSSYFNDTTNAPNIIFAVGLVNAIRALRIELRQKEQPTETESANLRFLSGRGSDWLTAAIVAKLLDVVLETAVPDRMRISFGKPVSLDVSKEYWMPLVRAVVNLHKPALPTSESGNLRNESAVALVLDEIQASFAALRPEFGVADNFKALVVTS